MKTDPCPHRYRPLLGPIELAPTANTCDHTNISLLDEEQVPTAKACDHEIETFRETTLRKYQKALLSSKSKSSAASFEKFLLRDLVQ
jgi:hypothetical protein